jgi:uncharacterized membrane protein HdeD (DUF308 family)
MKNCPTPPAPPPSAGFHLVFYSFLKIAGVLLLIAGLLAVIAANRETPILGAGMIPAGALLLLAQFGGQRRWKGFPWAPLLVAILIGIMTHLAFKKHMQEYFKRHAINEASQSQ